jgi:hypothetical protein
MSSSSRSEPAADESKRLGFSRRRWLFSVLLAVGLLSTQVSVVAAHGNGGHTPLARWHGLVTLFVGISIVVGAVIAKRTNRLSPTHALMTVLAGITVAGLGAILFEGLSADPTYTADTMPFPRAWYAPIALATGLFTMIVSFIVGLARWPTRPRYTLLGVLMGAWILYPELLPDLVSYTHPLGYLIVLSTPVLVGYIVWKDASETLSAVFRDPVVRRFSLGVGLVVALFFMATTGYLSVFPDDDAPAETVFTVLPVVYQLVSWPTLELYLPEIPLFVALSPGVVILNGMIGVLVSLNAAIIAHQWRAEERAGTTEGTAGTAAIMGSCTCGCCGPLVAKFAAVAAGPTIAAPLYWLFVDSASPLVVLFIVGSIVLFTGSLLYSVRTTNQELRSTGATLAD